MSAKWFYLVLMSIAVAEGFECPSRWSKFKGSCYYFGKLKVAWKDARSICQKQPGGHMASVTSEEEHAFIVQQIILEGTSHSWIGGNDIEKEGQWSWEATGAKVKFSKWNAGQPDDKDKTKNCLMMHAGLAHNWDDFDCASKQSFVCEIEGNELHPGPYPDSNNCFTVCSWLQKMLLTSKKTEK